MSELTKFILDPLPCKSCHGEHSDTYEAFTNEFKTRCNDCYRSTGLCKSANESIFKWNLINRRTEVSHEQG